MQIKSIQYQDGTTQCIGHMVFDEHKPLPQKTILIAPAFNGISDFIKDYAEKIVNAGYLAFVIDLAGDGKDMANIDDCIAHAMSFINDRNLAMQRVVAGYKAACAQAEVDENNIAIMGFCLGGMCALDLARSGANIKGAISLHGLLAAPDASAEQAAIKAKVLVLHGYEDKSIPPENLTPFADEMNAKNVDWQFMFFSHTKHAYTEPGAENFGPKEFAREYNETSARRAFVYAQDFFAEIFK